MSLPIILAGIAVLAGRKKTKVSGARAMVGATSKDRLEWPQFTTKFAMPDQLLGIWYSTVEDQFHAPVTHEPGTPLPLRCYFLGYLYVRPELNESNLYAVNQVIWTVVDGAQDPVGMFAGNLVAPKNSDQLKILRDVREKRYPASMKPHFGMFSKDKYSEYPLPIKSPEHAMSALATMSNLPFDPSSPSNNGMFIEQVKLPGIKVDFYPIKLSNFYYEDF